MSTSPSALTMIRGQPATWSLKVKGTDGSALTGVFTSSNTLACEVFYGADAALSVVPTAAWIDAPSGQYVLSFSAAQSASLPPGAYTLVVSESSGVTGAALLEAPLVVEAAPTDGTGLLRALAQPADYAAADPSQAANPGLAGALEAATRSIEAYCNRPLVLDAYDHCERPGRTRRIYLKAWPVQGELSLTDDVRAAATVWNRDATNQQASVSITPIAADSGQAARLTLRRTASGVATTDAFTLSDYPTIAALAAAIAAAGGGWTADAPGTGAAQGLALLPPSRLDAAGGAVHGALDQRVELRVYATEVSGYVLDPRKGVVELTGARPQAFRYPDRSHSVGYGFAWGSAGQPLHANVRCRYRAGYAIAQADLSLGYDPVPADLRRACILAARAIIESPTIAGAVKDQMVGPQRLTLRADASSIPLSARPLLNNYLNYRLGGGG